MTNLRSKRSENFVAFSGKSVLLMERLFEFGLQEWKHWNCQTPKSQPMIGLLAKMDIQKLSKKWYDAYSICLRIGLLRVTLFTADSVSFSSSPWSPLETGQSHSSTTSAPLPFCNHHKFLLLVSATSRIPTTNWPKRQKFLLLVFNYWWRTTNRIQQ